MTCGATYTQLASAIHIHPTLAEGVNSAAGGIHREIGAQPNPPNRAHADSVWSP
jgi:hypothetical protein